MIWRRIWIYLTHFDFCPLIFNHQPIRVLQEFGDGYRKLRCDGCGKYFAMSDHHGAIMPWDDELEELYSVTLGHGRTYL